MRDLTESSAKRIEIIDVLRGFTLLGIALVHFPEQYYAGVPPKIHEGMTTHSIIDTVVSGIVGVFITGKFFMIFSFLFGLSFFIQLNKSDGTASFILRFSWRLIVLFLIGFLHHLHYRGDILTIYAVLGFGLLVSYKLPDKILLWIALLLVFNVPSIVARSVALFTNALPDAFFNNDQAQLEAYFNTFKSGTYGEILSANLHEFAGKMDFQFASGRIYITMGLFLLGLWAGRKDVFSKPVLFRKLITVSLWTLLSCVIVAVAVFGILQMFGVEITQPIGFLVGGTAFDVFNAALSGVYVGLIVSLFQQEKWKKRLMIFYAVGRMGLTTYLMQAVAGVLIFSGIGLGLLGDIGSALSAVIGIAVFILQILFSNYWLSRFQYGPVEWLWRSLTYFKVQPLKNRN
jgi:uncharacterized protein